MITSTQNPLIKLVRRLRRDKRARESEGLFVVEGIQGVVEAVQSGAPVQAVLYVPEQLSSTIALEAIETARSQGVRVEALSTDLFELISNRDNPVGIAALVERRLRTVERLEIGEGALFVALWEVGDPGNLGTVLRTVDAVGADALLLVGQTVDPFHPTTVKASASTIFSVPVVQVNDLDTLLTWCTREGINVVATSDRAAEVYWALDYPSPLLLLMGSEAHGLPDTLLSTLPQVVRIPMHGTADSLNLGVATALLLYEVQRQRWSRQQRESI